MLKILQVSLIFTNDMGPMPEHMYQFVYYYVFAPHVLLWCSIGVFQAWNFALTSDDCPMYIMCSFHSNYTGLPSFVNICCKIVYITRITNLLLAH